MVLKRLDQMRQKLFPNVEKKGGSQVMAKSNYSDEIKIKHWIQQCPLKVEHSYVHKSLVARGNGHHYLLNIDVLCQSTKEIDEEK